MCLRATLHALRDRLGPETAVHLAAQLPMLVRGLYYERLAHGQHANQGAFPVRLFSTTCAMSLPQGSAIDPNMAVRAVFAVLSEKLDAGEVDNIINRLPGELRPLWD